MSFFLTARLFTIFSVNEKLTVGQTSQRLVQRITQDITAYIRRGVRQFYTADSGGSIIQYLIEHPVYANKYRENLFSIL